MNDTITTESTLNRSRISVSYISSDTSQSTICSTGVDNESQCSLVDVDPSCSSLSKQLEPSSPRWRDKNVKSILMGNNTVLLQHIYRIGSKGDVNQFRRILKNSSMSLLTTLLVRCRGEEWDTIAKLGTDQKIDRILPSEVRWDVSTPYYWSPRKAEMEKDIKRITSDIDNQSTLMFRAIFFQDLLDFVPDNQFGEPVSDFLVWHEMLQTRLSQYLRLYRHDQVQIFRYTQIANVIFSLYYNWIRN